MTSTIYKHEAQADLPGVAFGPMRQMIMTQVKSAGLKVIEDQEGRLTVETAHGLIGLRPGTSVETAGIVAAADERWLFVMKNAVLQQMRHVMPEVAESMRWTDGDNEGALPPNFTFAHVREVTQLGPVFLRVTLEAEDFSAYQNDAIHFRLVQPQKGLEPAWPTLAPNGAIKWPDGESAPHKPVYTARTVDHASNRLVTDVYIHEGGRTTEWAQEILSGERERRVVGLVGPSGGGHLNADRVLLASDETGFPAAARLLENLSDGARGQILLEAEHGADCAYPVDAPEGVEVVWLSRSKGDVLGQATLAALEQHAGAKIWFAGERHQATRLREAAKAAGWPPGDLRISGFWTAKD
ncbi:MAG: siderophore-interacting protein [Pseudomonadota bacterium]